MSILAVSAEGATFYVTYAPYKRTHIQIMGPIFVTYSSEVVIGLSSLFPHFILGSFENQTYK